MNQGIYETLQPSVSGDDVIKDKLIIVAEGFALSNYSINDIRSSINQIRYVVVQSIIIIRIDI